jgi:hypothetical protein
MKKFITAILAIIYMGSSTGATLHMHYCMGKLAEWGFGGKESKFCAGCGMEKTETDAKGCCKDEHKFIKNNIDQKTAEAGFQAVQLITVCLPADFFEIADVTFPSVTEDTPVSNPPPRSSATAVYILNRAFLI